MKRILVTTDFSEAAKNAIYYAADMALAINAELFLFNVVQTPIGYSDLPIVVSIEDMMRTAENDMQREVTEITNHTAGKLKIETGISMGGFLTELENICDQVKPYLVVMGSQGKTATEHFLFGTHASNAAKNLNWPLITVPPQASFKLIKKIGLAIDHTKVIESTPLEKIKLLVTDFNAELHIMNTGKKNDFEEGVVFESGMKDEMTTSLKPQFHFIDNDNKDEGIIDFAEKNEIDLLIVIPRHHNFLDSIFHKSHTKQLVLHSHVPVLAIHS